MIEPLNSDWAAPVLFAPKKDGRLRFCIDYRRLNEITVKDSYPIPRMDECIDSLGDAAVFTSLDAYSGYWQVAIKPEDRKKYAFICHSGHFQYVRMPFGLTNAPATFQRALDMIFLVPNAGRSGEEVLRVRTRMPCRSLGTQDTPTLSHVRRIRGVLRSPLITMALQYCRTIGTAYTLAAIVCRIQV